MKMELKQMFKLPYNLFDGYLSEVDDGIIISHISSKEKGRGNFSRLLRELKEKYPWIKIPTPSNQMREIALKKGFTLKQEFFPEPFNCMGKVLFWEKQKNEVKNEL